MSFLAGNWSNNEQLRKRDHLKILTEGNEDLESEDGEPDENEDNHDAINDEPNAIKDDPNAKAEEPKEDINKLIVKQIEVH